MKQLSHTIASLVLICITFTLPAQELLIPTSSKIVKVVEMKDRYLVFAQQEIYSLSKKNKVLSKYASAPAEILDAALKGDSTFIGTTKGLYVATVKKPIFQKIAFADGKELAVNVVLINQKGQVYAGVEAYGLYPLKNGKLELEMGFFPLSCGAVTSDSSIWIGTTSGLNRGKNNTWMRYNEEGVANYEIPDNVIERLIVDEKGILWIVTSDGVSFFELNATNHGHSHLPTTKFLGRPDNKVLDISYVKDLGYLFLTSIGTLYLPTEKGETHIHEFEHPEDDKVENHKSLRTINVSTNAVSMPNPEGILQSTNKKEILFFSGNNLLLVNKKDIVKRLASVL